MAQEFETQILNIDPDEIAQKLRKLGAKEEPEVLQKRWVFDIECNGSTVGEWIRLRQVKDKSTITYKNKSGSGISETEEIEVCVDDFDKTAELLSKLKCFTGQYYQENKRRKFNLEDIEFTLDTWPRIPPILEIEAKSEKRVKDGLKMIGLEGKDVGQVGLVKIYSNFGIDLHSIKELKFTKVK